MTRMIHSPMRDELVGYRAMGSPRSRREVPWVARRVGAVVVLFLATVVLVAAGSRPAEAQAAQPILGRYRVTHVFLNQDSSALKGGSAFCERGDYVLGGGAHAYGESPEIDQRLGLGEMMPVGAPRPGDGRHGFKAYAQEITPGTTSDWVLSVFALCAAEKPSGHRIVEGSPTSQTSSSVKDADTSCGTGRVALGAGARIEHNVYQPRPLAASLTEVRPSGTGAVTYAAGKEWPGGYSGTWRLRSFAVCADAPQGYEVRHTDTAGKLATATCTGDRQILGAGAATFTELSGAVPRRGPEGAVAHAARNGTLPTDVISAWATCANTAPAPPPPPPTPPPCPPQLPDCEEP